MPVSAQGFQEAVHAIEQGRLAPFVRGFVALVVLVALVLFYLFIQFAGFNSRAAMDQAQIGRHLVEGKGFATNYVRPMVLWQFDRAQKEIPTDVIPDISNPPLVPLFNALPLALVRDAWEMSPTDLIYAGDRAIAFASILIFFAAVAVGYFVARELFDAQLALIGSGILLVTDILWQFSLSGIGHPLAMLFLMLAALVIVKAMERQEAEQSVVPSLLHQLGIGLLFGLMTLTNYLSCWFFVGYLLFAFIYFRPRPLPIVAIVAFLLTLAPWLYRNFQVSGDLFGIAIYPISDDSFLRTLSPNFDELFFAFREKLRLGIVNQVGNIFSYLGLNIAAGAFFVALFHGFKRPEASHFRWCILSMWVCAAIGSAAYGPIVEVIDNLQVHSLFIPLFVYFGLAFLLVLWNRLHIDLSLFRMLFISGIVALCAIPMILGLIAGQSRTINWPPYVPPYIAALGKWFGPEEAIASDMPWAVAWYAQRRSLLLPDTPETMVKISDYDLIGAPIRGLYLTPVTGNQPYLDEIVMGRYKPWSPFITRTANLANFPLKAAIPLPVMEKTVLYADYARWMKRQSEPAENPQSTEPETPEDQ